MPTLLSLQIQIHWFGLGLSQNMVSQKGWSLTARVFPCDLLSDYWSLTRRVSHLPHECNIFSPCCNELHWMMSLLTCYCSLHLYRAIKLLVSYCYYFLPCAVPPWDNAYKTALQSTKNINTCVLLIRHGHGDISRVLDTREQLWS